MQTINDIRKIIKFCPLEIQFNPKFIAFRLITTQAANVAVKRLAENNFDAKRFGKYVKIEIQTVIPI